LPKQQGNLDGAIVDYHRGEKMSKKDLLETIAPGEILREDFMEPIGITSSFAGLLPCQASSDVRCGGRI